MRLDRLALTAFTISLCACAAEAPASHESGLAAIEAHLDPRLVEGGPGLEARAVGGGQQLESASQGFTATVSERGIEVARLGATISLRTIAIGRTGVAEPMRALAPGRVEAAGARVRIARDSVDELFVHGALGVEHALAISARPAGEGELVVRLAIGGASIARAGDGALAMLGEDGRSLLVYEGLRAWDGTGRELAARFELDGGGARIVVDDRDAIAPIVIDPLIAAPRGVLEPSDGVADDEFGASVAYYPVLGREVVLVGAPEHGGTGAVYAYERTATGWAQRAVLTAPDGREGDQFGASIGYAAGRVVVGAPGDESVLYEDAGAIYVFRSSGPDDYTFEQRIENPDPMTSPERFGRAVAIDAGDTIVVGAPNARAYFIGGGAAYVFTRAGTAWTLDQALEPSTYSSNDAFGSAVAARGGWIVAGSPYDDGIAQENVGAAFVFRRDDAGDWQQRARLVGTTERSWEHIGSSVAIDDAGTARVIVGATGADDDEGLIRTRGVAYVFAADALGTTWAQEARLLPSPSSDWTDYGAFGSSVAISGDLAVASGPGIYRASLGRDPGFAYVYQRGPGGWAPVADVTGRLRTSDFGASVALHASTLIAGAPGEDVTGATGRGAAYAYELIMPGPLGDACATGVECESGFCADGVCCNEACGGVARDCRACSVAAGALSDGTCATASGGSTCRASSDACDVAETCDGAAITCPPDVTADDGAACDDGMSCNGADVCSAGVCMAGTMPPACDDDDVCTRDACADPAGCTHTPVADCCVEPSDCPMLDECSIPRCEANVCVYAVTSCGDGAVADVDGGLDGGALEADAGTSMPPVTDPGCGCSVPGARGGAGSCIIALGMLALAITRRRRSCRS